MPFPDRTFLNPPNNNFPNNNLFPGQDGRNQENLPDDWIRVGELFNSEGGKKPIKRRKVGTEYLEAILDTLRNILPDQAFKKIHSIALPKAGGRANANKLEKLALDEMMPVRLHEVSESEVRQAWLRVNQWYNAAKEAGRAVENYVNAARFIMDEFKDRGLDYNSDLPVARAAQRLRKSEENPEAPAITKDDLIDLPSEVMIVPDFISIVGSSIRSEDPRDVDVLYRANLDEKGDFLVSWENIYLAMRNTLKTIKPDLDMHEIFNPQGSREARWLPVYNLVLRKSKNDMRLTKDEQHIEPRENNQQILTTPPGVIEDFDLGAPCMPNWRDYLNDTPPDGIWTELGCGPNKAEGFIGVDKNAYPGVDMVADLEKAIPFSDDSVSVIRANHFVEHLSDFDRFMKEAGRVLMKGGRLIMTMPSTDGEGAEIHPDHKIFMNKTEFENKIKDLDYLFHPIAIKERRRENNGFDCVDIDAVLERKERKEILLPNSRDGVLSTQPFFNLDGVEKIAKISPGVKFVGAKPAMAGYTEAFEVGDLAKWAEKKYPIDIEGKLNGNRCFITKKGQDVELWFEGQMGTNQFDKMPDIRDGLKKIPEDFILDLDLALLRSGKRVIRADDMIFNKRELDLKPNEIPIITVFDLIYREKDISQLPWYERRKELENFFNKYLRGKKNFAITTTRIVKSPKGLKAATRWAFGQDMSEGLVAKQVNSPYQQGGTSYWYKLKKVAELKLIVLGKKKTKANDYVYEAGLSPSPNEKLNAHETDLQGKKYISMGNTLASNVQAKVGDIITVQILELLPDYDKETLAWVGPRVQDVDDTRKQPYSVAQSLDISDRAQLLQKALKNIVPSSDPHCEKCFSGLAFVGSSPGKTEALRGEPLVGPSGETFNDVYLKTLGLKRDQVFITNAVPKLLTDENGSVREPTDSEIKKWQGWLFDELDRVNPDIVVALGRTAKKALNGEADVVMPHPMAIRRFGDSGEVGRKIKHIKNRLSNLNKDTIGPGDVHVDNTNWKVPKRSASNNPGAPSLSNANGPEILDGNLKFNSDWRKPDSWFKFNKADSEGGDETRAEASSSFWSKNWQNMYPFSSKKIAKGRFTYQHHWRGLSKEEDAESEIELLDTDHSVHGDLRLTAGHEQKSLWGFSVFIGKTSDNKNGDRLINLPPDDKLQGAFKLEQPIEWLTIARGKPHTAEPGEPGSTSKTYSKFFEQDHGEYKAGVWKKHVIEIFLLGPKLKGRYLIEFAPVGGSRKWLINKPKDQTPLAESKNIKAEIADQKKKGYGYIIWGAPDKEPIPIKLSGSKEDGFIMADDLLSAMESEKDPWKAYESIHKECMKKSVYAEIIKADDEKRLVYGVVLEPDGVDAQNDTISKDEIERAAHVYLKDSRTVGDSHKKVAKAAHVVESYIAPTDFELGGQNVKQGTWVMVVKIDDDDTWNRVKNHELTGFSIGGFSKRIPVSGPVTDQIPYERPPGDTHFNSSIICY